MSKIKKYRKKPVVIEAPAQAHCAGLDLSLKTRLSQSALIDFGGESA